MKDLILDEYDLKIFSNILKVLVEAQTGRFDRETQNVKFKGYWVQNILRVDIEAK